MASDRLDGSKKKSAFVEFFLLPGRLILWINYMFPNSGYSKTRGSARHARSPIMTFLYSVAAWVVLIGLVVYLALNPEVISAFLKGSSHS